MTVLLSRSRRLVRGARRDISSLVFSAKHRGRARVLGNAMPKAGTNLLIRLLSLLGFRHGGHFDIGPSDGIQRFLAEHAEHAREALAQIRTGHFSSSHCYFFPEVARIIDQLSIKTVTIIRDPRDVCVSDAYYIARTPGHRLYPYYSRMNEDERLMASIVGMTSDQLDGAPPSLDIGSHYRSFLGWATWGIGIVRFEDLIGDKGRGDERTQRETVARLARYLGLEPTDLRLADICANLFSQKARTFRRGQIGDWREHFGSGHKTAFNRVIGSAMQDYGYAGQ